MSELRAVRVLDGPAVRRLLPVADCIAAIEDMLSSAVDTPSFVGGVAADGGKFHLKAALSTGSRALFAAKINANFPGNPSRGRPTIQGILALFDGKDGSLLAIMDSMSLTAVRTAAASAVAARRLAPRDADTLAIAGCGAQALPHLEAIRAVRPIRRVILYDTNPGSADALASRVDVDLEAVVTRDLSEFRDAAVVVTCTSSRQAFLRSGHVRDGACVLAVGADSPDKSEIAPDLYARSFVIVDDLEQCAAGGDLHHALTAGSVERAHVRGTLRALVAGGMDSSPSSDEVRLFDSTGIPVEDVAAAAAVFARAELENAGDRVQLS